MTRARIIERRAELKKERDEVLYHAFPNNAWVVGRRIEIAAELQRLHSLELKELANERLYNDYRHMLEG